MERRTPGRFPFIADIDIRGGALQPPNEVFNQKPNEKLAFRLYLGENYRVFDLKVKESFAFIKYRSAVLREFYPQFTTLEVNIYSASGWNSTKEYMKVSFHLVWPEIILNEDTAKIIRERTMEKFEEWADDPSHPIAYFKKNVIDIDPSNTWDDVFDDTTTHETNGVRMPYCDKASEVLKKEFIQQEGGQIR